MLQFRSIRVVLVLALLLNTAPAAVFRQPMLPTPLNTGSADKKSITFDSSRSAVVSGHIDSALAGSVPVDSLTLEDSRVTAATQGSAATSRVSVASDGTQGDGTSGVPRISADGRYVVFSSQARNLVSGDTNNAYDIFVRDREMGQTTRVSVTSGGGQGDGPSFVASISADGRYVAFRSMATNLVIGDNNHQDDVFLHDRDTRETIRISVGPGGVEGNGPSIKPAISADGKYVAFESWATNLVNGDNNGREDVFLYDRQSRQVTRVSVAPGGAEANDESDLPAISADGRYMAFASQASNLAPGDTNNVCDTNNDGIFTDNCPDVFVYDRDTGQIQRVSVGTGGTQSNGWSATSSLSADGRYVAFESQAHNLVIGDNNGVYDIFVRDQQANQTWRVSVDSNGREGNGESVSPAISADGRFVAFVSRADNLVVGDTNGADDVFVHDRETHRTIRVSVATDGRQGLDTSDNPALSADGRYVAFASLASNLVNGDTNGQKDVFVRDRGDGLGNTMTIPLVSGSDDASVEMNCVYRPDWKEIYLGRCNDGSSIVSGFRFRGVQIAAGTVISEAYLELTVDGTYSNDIASQIFGQASVNSAPFSDTDRPSDRPLTTNFVNWSIPASDVWSVGQSRRSPDLTSIVQEIVNLPGWASGNSLTMILHANPAVAGNAHRRVFAWEREENGDRTARLVVTFGGGGTIPPTTTFLDVPLDHWAHDAIETLYQVGVTAACSRDPLMYCPDSSMNRAESAMFVEHGVHGIGFIPTQPITQVFADVPLNSWAAKWATAVWAEGYTAGCATNPLRYCPWQTHTRAEGSALYLRVLNGTSYVPPDPAGIFADVPLDQWYARWAEAAYNAGLIRACQTSPQLRFCPNDPMTRAMSAYALAAARSQLDTIPPDGRITSPANGSTIGPGTTSVFIRADAWDNPGGSGVDRVRFYVEYDGARHHVCTDTDNLPSCTWSIPPELAAQQLVFTINVVDRAGNIRGNAGGPVYVTYQSSGDTTPPDGRITSPTNGSTIGPGITSLFIRADAWDNPGGSGVDRVRFYVEYDGVRNHVCTDTDNLPSCTWSIPSGLASQQLALTINVVDKAGNIRERAGGPIYITYVPPPTPTPTPGSQGSLHLTASPFFDYNRPIIISGRVDNPTGTTKSYTVIVSLQREGATLATQTQNVIAAGHGSVNLSTMNFGTRAAGSYTIRAELKIGASLLQVRLFTVRVLSEGQIEAFLQGGVLKYFANAELNQMRDMVANRYGDAVIRATEEVADFLTGELIGLFSPIGDAAGFRRDVINGAISEVVTLIPKILGWLENVRRLGESWVEGQARNRIDGDLSSRRQALDVWQEDFNTFVANQAPFSWTDRLATLVTLYVNAISTRTEQQRFQGIQRDFPFFSRNTTLWEENLAFDSLGSKADTLGYIIVGISILILLIIAAAAFGITFGGSLVAVIAAIYAVLKGSKITAATVLLILALAMHVTVKELVGPAVATYYYQALNTLKQHIHPGAIFSIEGLRAEASVQGGEVTLSTSLTNTADVPASPLLETYVYGVDGNIVEILSGQPSVNAQETATWRNTITLPPGRYKAVATVHTSDEIGLMGQVAFLEIPSPSVAVGISLDKTQVSPGQAIQAVVSLTNTNTISATGGLSVFAQFSHDQDFDAWAVDLVAGGSKHLTYSFVPQATGSQRMHVTVSDGTRLVASHDAAYVVGNGAALAVNIASQTVYSPSLAVAFPVTATNAGNLPTSTILSLVTLDRMRGPAPVYTDTRSLSVSAMANVITGMTALPTDLSKPGSYTARVFLGGELYTSLDFAVAAQDTLFAGIAADRVFHNVGDTIPLTVTVMNSVFAYTDASVTVSIWQPSGVTGIVAMNRIGTGLYRGTFTAPISGTYVATVTMSKPNHQTGGSSTIFIAGEMGQLQSTVDGHPVLNAANPVTFTVRNERGIPIAGASVVVSGTEEYHSDPTNEMGQVVLQLSPVDTVSYEVTVEKSGFALTLMDLPIWSVPRIYLPLVLRNH